MDKRILIHGSGHKASSWDRTISYLDGREDRVYSAYWDRYKTHFVEEGL